MTTIKLSFFLAMSRGGESKAAYVFPDLIVIRLQNSIHRNGASTDVKEVVIGIQCEGDEALSFLVRYYPDGRYIL